MSNSTSTTVTGQPRLSALFDVAPLTSEQTDDIHRKTKITCTLGPATGDVDKIVKLLECGMNVARLNFSHGTHTSHLEMLNKVRAAMAKANKKCAVMLDTKGPEIRTGLLKNGVNVILKQGSELTILCDVDFNTYEGDEHTICVDYANLPNVVHAGSTVKIDDGLIVTRVISTSPGQVRVSVLNTAELGQRKGVNLPNCIVDLPGITNRDKLDIAFAVEHQFDLIAASFTRNADTVHEIRSLLGEKGKDIKIICKIENQEGLDNFDSILAACDGIMVARGDLGVEIPIQKVCMMQKMMIRKCNLIGKPVITATQMLESMTTNPRPTRAEATDVANAVFDGTDCVMLSGETAKGDYPFDAVTVMARICLTAEAAIDYNAAFQTMVYFSKKPISRAEAITSSAVKTAIDLDVGAIIVLTETGSSARFVSKYRPPMPVITITHTESTANYCRYVRGLWPIVVPRASDDELIAAGIEYAKSHGWIDSGSMVVVVSGIVQGVAGSTNSMKVIDVE